MTAGSESPGGRPRVLVVDDDASIAALVPRVLDRLGGSCRAVASAEEALGALAEEEWDLLITDLTLPGMDGLSLIQEAARRRAELPLLVLTGDVRAAIASEALAAGAHVVMVKPFKLDELRDAVTRLTAQGPPSVPGPAAI